MKLIVDVPGTGEVEVTARNGWTVMEAMRDANIPVRGECGGGKICATCHIHVSAPFYSGLSPVDEEEAELLEGSETYDPASSRLSCQILCSDQIDGMQLALQPDAFGM